MKSCISDANQIEHLFLSIIISKAAHYKCICKHRELQNKYVEKRADLVLYITFPLAFLQEVSLPSSRRINVLMLVNKFNIMPVLCARNCIRA